MNSPRRLRETVDYWSKTHPDARLDQLAVTFYTPGDGPDDVVLVVVARDEEDTDVARMPALRPRIGGIARRGAVGPLVIDARTLVSEILIRGRRNRSGTGDADE